MTDSLFDGDAAPAGDDARRPGRRRTAASGRTGERSRSGGGRSGFGDGGRGRGSRRRDDAAPAAEDPGGAAGPPDEGMDDPEAVARGICLRALTGAAKTRQQLAELLARKDVPTHAAEAVLDRFTEVGLIDDAAFASAWVSSRQAGRGLARRALAAELRAKGVDGDVAAAAVAEVDPQEEWDAARRLVQRKAPAMRRLDRVTAERRLVGMLARKGYGGGLAGIVVREALDELHADDDLVAEADDPDEAIAPTSPWGQADGEAAGDTDGDAAEDVPTGGRSADRGSGGRSGGGGFGRRTSGRGLSDPGGGAGWSSGGGSTGGFGSGGFGGRTSTRRAAGGKPNGSALGGGGAGGIAGQRAASMADEVGEGHWEPIARRPGTPPERRR